MLFAFELAFFFTPFFHDFKGIKTKEKDKDKEKTESESGHSWTGTDSGPGSGPLPPDFDSGSGYGSAFTDPQSSARLKARIGGTSFAFFKWTLLI